MKLTDWDLGDKSMQTKAPFEGSAAYRMHVNGMPSRDIMKTLKLRGTQFIKELELQQHSEQSRREAGCAVHDGFITNETE